MVDDWQMSIYPIGCHLDDRDSGVADFSFLWVGWHLRQCHWWKVHQRLVGGGRLGWMSATRREPIGCATHLTEKFWFSASCVLMAIGGRDGLVVSPNSWWKSWPSSSVSYPPHHHPGSSGGFAALPFHGAALVSAATSVRPHTVSRQRDAVETGRFFYPCLLVRVEPKCFSKFLGEKSQKVTRWMCRSFFESWEKKTKLKFFCWLIWKKFEKFDLKKKNDESMVVFAWIRPTAPRLHLIGSVAWMYSNMPPSELSWVEANRAQMDVCNQTLKKGDMRLH
jgi:hypothetical protein